MQLVKIENLYRNIFTQALVTEAEQIQDYHVPQQDRVEALRFPCNDERLLSPLLFELEHFQGCTGEDESEGVWVK